MLVLLVSTLPGAVAYAAAPEEVPRRLVRTPGGDRFGYAPVARPYTRALPERVTGLLVSHDPLTGAERRCGAAVVASESRSLVLTAAHCLFDNDGQARRWYDQVTFVPAYSGSGAGGAPLGVWRAVRTWVTRPWRTRSYSTEVIPHDVGVVGVEPDASGRRLEDVTGPGLRPVSTRRGDGRVRAVTLPGYPSELGYPGDAMYRCSGRAAEARTPWPGMLMTRNCQIVRGHSGGPAISGRAVVGVATSSSPYHDPDGFSLIARLSPRRAQGLLAVAERGMAAYAAAAARSRHQATVADSASPIGVGATPNVFWKAEESTTNGRANW
ncbi:hypothetical protein DP939_08865 [Spongiactinospora rosea]|uniref:V8-like Glu-specific endopeptidase n=1 Tax=Spongiactinospora rosea TaxID=2248750 RepID=A0A366M2B6_9ACTN|nr:hypothetical protein DP939_08865 [Spongiactinospora rosea]